LQKHSVHSAVPQFESEPGTQQRQPSFVPIGHEKERNKNMCSKNKNWSLKNCFFFVCHVLKKRILNDHHVHANVGSLVPHITHTPMVPRPGHHCVHHSFVNAAELFLAFFSVSVFDQMGQLGLIRLPRV
jgi:hypothetical protein